MTNIASCSFFWSSVSEAEAGEIKRDASKPYFYKTTTLTVEIEEPETYRRRRACHLAWLPCACDISSPVPQVWQSFI